MAVTVVGCVVLYVHDLFIFFCIPADLIVSTPLLPYTLSQIFVLRFFFVFRQGPVEVDQTVSTTLLKEFNKENLCSENATEEERQLMSEHLEQLFANGIPVSQTTENNFTLLHESLATV